MSAPLVARRQVLKSAAVLAAGTTLAACAPKIVEVEKTVEVEKQVEVEKEVTVMPTAAPREAAEVILMYQTNEISDDELAIFNEKYAPYKVTRIDVDFTKLYAMLAASEPVDVVRVLGTFIPRFVIQRICKDLTDYFDISTVVKPDDLLPANDLYLVNGRRYGMVKDWSPDASIWINKKLWEEAGVELPDPKTPVTLQEWRALSPQLTKKEGDRTLVVGTDFETSNSTFMWAVTTFEPPTTLFNEDFTRLNLVDNPDTIEFLQFWFDWMQEKGLPHTTYNPFPSESWSGQDWVQGQAAAVMWGYWFGGMAVSEFVAPEDILMLSAPGWGPNYTNPCCSGCGAFVTSTTRVPDAAWKVFEWFMGEEPAENRAKGGWGVPGLKSLLSLMPVDAPWRQHAFDMVNLEIERSTTAFARWSQFVIPDTFTASWVKYEEPALRGEITLDEMLRNVESEVNEALQDGVDEAGL